MPTEEAEKTAGLSDVLTEVAKIKAMIAEAVDDGVRSAVRAIKQGRYKAEEAIDDAKHVVRKNPFEAVGVVFLAGFVTGGVIAWMATRRGKEEEAS
jgi:ElaB/YqjD/DUF883 family membrane-anchored ribosome-binding protein